jgi:hypothetical protein
VVRCQISDSEVTINSPLFEFWIFF